MRSPLLGTLLILATSCGGLLPPKMRDTKIPSGGASYDAMAAEATKLGWKSERSEGSHDGLYFWMLRVTTPEGGKLYFTKNNRTGNVAFTCDGAGVDGEDACHAAANKIFEPAFQGKYVE